LYLEHKSDRVTSEDAAAQAGDALDLRQVVVSEVVVTRGVAPVARRAEALRQPAGRRHVAPRYRLGADVEAVPHQRPVPQHADPAPPPHGTM